MRRPCKVYRDVTIRHRKTGLTATLRTPLSDVAILRLFPDWIIVRFIDE